jgi:hypothetical protein
MPGRRSHIIESADVAVARVSGEYKLLSTGSIPAGGYLYWIDGELTGIPSRHSVQIDSDVHVDVADGHTLEECLDLFIWRFMNHSCEPNAVIRGRDVLTVRPINRGEELTFNYNTTEYEMAEPFDCNCETSRCGGRIQGFRYISRAERERLRPWLAPHLLRLLDSDAEPGVRVNREAPAIR